MAADLPSVNVLLASLEHTYPATIAELRAAIEREKDQAVQGAFTEAMIAASDAVPPEAFDNRDIRVATVCVKAIRQAQVAAAADKEAGE